MDLFLNSFCMVSMMVNSFKIKGETDKNLNWILRCFKKIRTNMKKSIVKKFEKKYVNFIFLLLNLSIDQLIVTSIWQLFTRKNNFGNIH